MNVAVLSAKRLILDMEQTSKSGRDGKQLRFPGGAVPNTSRPTDVVAESGAVVDQRHRHPGAASGGKSQNWERVTRFSARDAENSKKDQKRGDFQEIGPSFASPR
jgi:hypothetical protein